MSGDKKPVVAFTRYSPYMIIDAGSIENFNGELLKIKPVVSLCRCGLSKNKPFCDETHTEKGIDGEKQPERALYKWKDYRGKDITVHFNLGVCSHDGSCVRMLPRVFNINCKPWITPDNGDVDKIIDVIKHCPSGALSYTLNGKKYIDFYNGEPKIKVARKGPLEFYGGIILKDDMGSEPETSDHYTLCRCGHSLNKPFCDGKHLNYKIPG
jgi:CDGSH-type Zn-finger protein